jgi:hypothetical protein
MAEICGFLGLRTLRSRTLFIDNGSRERHALAAFRLAAERPIRLAGTFCAAARCLAYVLLTNRITDTNDHDCSLAEP